jgi:hypothetical protein
MGNCNNYKKQKQQKKINKICIKLRNVDKNDVIECNNVLFDCTFIYDKMNYRDKLLYNELFKYIYEKSLS